MLSGDSINTYCLCSAILREVSEFYPSSNVVIPNTLLMSISGGFP